MGFFVSAFNSSYIKKKKKKKIIINIYVRLCSRKKEFSFYIFAGQMELGLIKKWPRMVVHAGSCSDGDH